MPGPTPRDLYTAHPEKDFLVAEVGYSSRYMVAIHRAFYTFVASQLTGGLVLDAGCGTGFGTALLAERAGGVLGIDVKPLVTRYAQHHYGGRNLAFVPMDATAMGFANTQFGTIVANELVEHLDAHRLFLEETVRLLMPAGRFICATVNRAHTFSSGDRPLNNHHFREYDAVDFRSELERYFGQVELYGQGLGEEFERYLNHGTARRIQQILMKLNLKRRISPEWRSRVRSWLSDARIDQDRPEQFRVTRERVEESIYLVAVAARPR